jgi:hypothetical protein
LPKFLQEVQELANLEQKQTMRMLTLNLFIFSLTVTASVNKDFGLWPEPIHEFHFCMLRRESRLAKIESVSPARFESVQQHDRHSRIGSC